MVRVDPKVQELATEITDKVMTALKMDGRALMLARRKAKTNGEYLVLAPEALDKSAWSDGTMSPRMNREMT